MRSLTLTFVSVNILSLALSDKKTESPCSINKPETTEFASLIGFLVNLSFMYYVKHEIKF